MQFPFEYCERNQSLAEFPAFNKTAATALDTTSMIMIITETITTIIIQNSTDGVWITHEGKFKSNRTQASAYY